LTHHGAEIASTYPRTSNQTPVGWDTSGAVHAALGQGSFAMSDAYTLAPNGIEYLVVRVRASGFDSNDGFDAFLGRDLQAELAPMMGLTQKLALVGVLAIAVTLLAAWAVATHITGPLSAIVEAARELQKGNFSAPLAARGADEVAFLAQSFAEMRQSLHRHMEHLRNLDQMKSNFIAIAGHELKTPLTVIAGFNEMIVNGMMGEVPEKVRETTQLIQKRLQDLNRLVENILDMSRFEQGLHEFRLAEVDLRELATDAVHRREADLGGRELRFTVERSKEACRVHADPERLLQAILHLLDNAVRFTPDGGRISVAVRPDGDRHLLTVRDTGVGIPANELDWIFDKVYEVGDIMNHSSGRSQFGSRGLGMGLALAKAIVEGHGGDIRVRSAPNAGSEFTIGLPAASAALQAETMLEEVAIA
jgi:signal transduction histidine kinase